MASCPSLSSSFSEPLPPPSYAVAVSPSSSSSSVGSHSPAVHANLSLSRQFLTIHSATVQQEKELNSIRSLLASSPLDASLNQRYQNALMELQSLYAHRKQISSALLQKESPINLLHRQQTLQTEINNLNTLLRAADLDRDTETIRVLTAQLQWKKLKLQTLTQKLTRTANRAYVRTTLQIVFKRPKAIIISLVLTAALWKVGLGPFRMVWKGMWKAIWFLLQKLRLLARPKLALKLMLFLFLSRWFGPRGLFILFLLLAFKFR